MATTSVFLLQEPHEQYERQKDRCWKMSPPGQTVSKTLLRKSGGQLLTSPERMKRLGQSRNDAQLCTCLVVKEKFDTVNNNIA